VRLALTPPPAPPVGWGTGVLLVPRPLPLSADLSLGPCPMEPPPPGDFAATAVTDGSWSRPLLGLGSNCSQLDEFIVASGVVEPLNMPVSSLVSVHHVTGRRT